MVFLTFDSSFNQVIDENTLNTTEFWSAHYAISRELRRWTQ